MMDQSNRLAKKIEKYLERKRKIDERIRASQSRCDHHPHKDGKGIICAKCGADLTPAPPPVASPEAPPRASEGPGKDVDPPEKPPL